LKGKIALSGFVIALLFLIIKYTFYSLSSLGYNAILPIFQTMNVGMEYGLDIAFSATGFLIFSLVYMAKPQTVQVKWQDEEGNIKTKSRNIYIIGLIVGMIIIFFSPITQIIMFIFYYLDLSYLTIFILGLVEALGWTIAAYGIGKKVVAKCFNCNKVIKDGTKIKCKDCKNVFCSENCYDEHMLYTHEKCAICGKGFGRGARYETCSHKECKNLKFCSPNCLSKHNELKHS